MVIVWFVMTLPCAQVGRITNDRSPIRASEETRPVATESFPTIRHAPEGVSR